MVKKVLLLLVCLLLGLGVYTFFFENKAPEFELEEGYTLLYDGRALDGWRVIGGQSSFVADGDTIVGRHGPGENTFLRTEKTYADFSLKMQMRWDEPGNSGVLFRAAQRNGDGQAYGYQYELDYSDRAWSAGVYDEARRGWLASLENNEAARHAIRLDDWNDIEIEARGPRLKTWINGVAAADIIDGLDQQGFIALQVHSGNVGQMRWRRLRIKELPPLGSPGPDLAPVTEWRLENISDFEPTAEQFNGTLGEGGGWMAPRRQLTEAQVAMTVPACDKPTIIRMRYNAGDGGGASYAEVSIYADRAQGKLVTAGAESVFDPVELSPAERHRFVGVTVGDAITFSVDETDALRLSDSGLDGRGQLRIQPAACASAFAISDFSWQDQQQKSSEVLFYQTLDTQPAPVLSPEQALGAFHIAPGFDIELVAAEPLVEDPVAMAWDEYGRLYVVEMRGYMPDPYGTGSEEPVGQVVRLEDIDGDGRMDTSVVFLGALVNPRAVAVVNEGVLIGEPPNLWLCEMNARDDLCDRKRRVGGYATNVAEANVEHMENSLLPGMDNWLYNAKSDRKLRLNKGVLEQQQGLNRGQWGMGKDDYGRLFYNHNSTWLQVDLLPAEDLVVPGSATYPAGLGVNLMEPSEVFSVRVNPGVNRAYLEDTLREDGRLHKATGVSGLAVYRGDQFPPAFAGDVFVPEVAANVVAQFQLEEQGMELSAKQRLYEDERWGQRDFLGSTDERFRPVDAMNGPDGALYVIDMYRGIVQDDHFLTDELREQIFQRQLDTPIGMGRIWRVRHRDGKTERAVPDLANASDAQLSAALSHANGWVRDMAQRLLLVRDGELRPDLEKVSLGADVVPAIHAIWTLQGRGELQRELVLALARLEGVQRQAHALRAGRSQLQVADLLTLLPELEGAAEAVQIQLAFAMGQYAGQAAIRAQLQNTLLMQPESIYVRQSILRAVQGHEQVFLRELMAGQVVSVESAATRQVLSQLAANAYRSLRGELDSDQPANPALQDLLALIASRDAENSWQQIAMLEGLQGLTVESGFKPAHLDAVPPVFTDGSVSESDPLWRARLGGRRAFTWPGDEVALGLTPLSPEQLQLLKKGEAFFVNCAACHGESGGGTPGLAPPLAAASWVTGPPEWLGRIILQGMSGPVEVAGEQWNAVMPPHGHLAELDDATLAGLMTFMRRSWGNRADPVAPAAALAIRHASAGRDKPWTVPELEAVPYDRGFGRFEGKYSVSFVTVTITQESDGLHIAVPMYGGGLMTQLSDTLFEASAGGEQVKVEFVVEEDGSVRKFFLHREGEKIPVERDKG